VGPLGGTAYPVSWLVAASSRPAGGPGRAHPRLWARPRGRTSCASHRRAGRSGSVEVTPGTPGVIPGRWPP